jgi:DNA polymerase I-like protein with 3'-5' exonuclease and polymerase domains
MEPVSVIFLDIETNTSHDIIWCCVTKKDNETKIWTKPDGLQSYLQDQSIVGHNLIGFDAYHLNRLWNTRIRLSQCIDTLVLSRLLNPNREGGHSLDAFGKRLGLEKIDFKDYDAGLSEEMIEYCVRDVDLLERVYHELQREKSFYGFGERAVEIEHEVAAIICKQERRGFKLDLPRSMALVAELSDRMGEIESELQRVFQPITTERISEKTGKRLKDNVEVFNPGSRQQIARRLQALGWKPAKMTEKGAVIVDETTLSGFDIPEAKLVAEYLMLQKRHSQVKSWLDAVEEDGRVRGKVITNGAVTGRMTHHSPNMAQIPSSSSPYGHECRACWTVDDGYKLVGADASGLELRMLAHYMKDEDYVQEVCEGDIHTKNQIAAGLQERAQAKTFIYALLYGAGAAKIGAIVSGGAKEGQRLIDSFLDNTPSLKTLRSKVERLAEKGTLPGLDERQLHVRSAHAALNTLLQSAGAIVMKQALIILNRKLQKVKLNAHFVVNVHDEWQIEVAAKDAEKVGQMAVQAITEAGKALGLRCPLAGEYKVGSNWADTH